MITPKYTREIPQRYRLEAGKCAECGYLADAAVTAIRTGTPRRWGP